MDASPGASFLLPMENTTMGEMIQSFLSCQRCSQVSVKPKQLKCTHTICTRCALRKRKRNVEAGAWMLQCLSCGRMNIWRDDYGELSGLEDNHLMKQVLKQMTGRQTILSESLRGPSSSSFELDFSTMYGDKNMTVNIVSAVKEKIEIQEALTYAEKKMMKCQQQTRYIKSYEKRISASKAAMAKKIAHSAEILIANVIQEQARLMSELDELYEEEMRPVEIAKDNMKKQTMSLELLTRCCEVATRMLHSGRAPLDMDSFKKMVQKSMKSSKEHSMPAEMKRKYRTNVQFICDERGFQKLVKNFGRLQAKSDAASYETEFEDKQVNETTDFIKKVTPEQDLRPELSVKSPHQEPIYDLPPDALLEFDPSEHQSDQAVEDTIYDEIPEEYYALPYEPAERPYEDTTPVDDEPTLPDEPPPRPPKHNKIVEEEEQVAAMVLAQRRRQTATGTDSDGTSSDTFSSDTDQEEMEPCQPPALPPRPTFSATSSATDLKEQLQQFLNSPPEVRRCVNNSWQQPSETESVARPPTHSSNESNLSPFHRSPSIRSAVSHFSESPPRKAQSRFLFSIGRIRKPGSRESQMFTTPPEIAAGGDGNIWISDTNSHRIQAHEDTCGNVVASFKTTLNGVTLKPKGLAVVDKGSKIATTCGKYVIVWQRDGTFVRKYGPRTNLGKMFGVAEGADGHLVLADVENMQIALESSAIKITAIGAVAGGIKQQNWPGRLAVNGLGQIITADYSEHCVKIFNPDGSLVTKFGNFGTGHDQMRYPSAVAVDSHDRIYVSDECNNRVTVFSSDGSTCQGHILGKEDGLNFPHAIAVLASGNIAVCDDSKLVKVFSGCEL